MPGEESSTDDLRASAPAKPQPKTKKGLPPPPLEEHADEDHLLDERA
jgi:hypothetical protein